jgi:hypothetical protein
MSTVTAALFVNFDDGRTGDAFLQLEIDSREDGFNGGNTTFGPGEQPVYLEFKTSSITVLERLVSAGLIQPLNLVAPDNELLVEEFITFPRERTQPLSKPIDSGFTFKWLGNDLGTITPIDELTVQAATNGIGVAKVTYTAKFEAFRLVNIPFPLNGENEFPVLVFHTGSDGIC